MLKCFLIILFIVLFSCVQLYIIDHGSDNSTLVLLHVIMRHGDRTPDTWNTFPYDTYKNHTYYPVGHGQLLTKGKTKIYKLGQIMRKRYNLFLGEYNHEAVYAKATNFKRTKATLEVLLAALYPPARNQWFNTNVNWQPIPYVYDKADQDIMSVTYLHCASFLKHYYAYYISEKGQKAIEGFKDMFRNLTQHTGLTVTGPREVAAIYAVLKGQVDWGLSLPEWAKPYWEKGFHLASALDYELSTVTPQLIRLSAGHLLRKILEDTKHKVVDNLPKHRKVYVYAGHEFNIGTMMRALKVYYRHFPPYAAALVFEIHKMQGGHGLKLLYHDHTSDDPKVLTIPGCTEICPLEEVESMFRHHIATDADTCSENREL